MTAIWVDALQIIVGLAGGLAVGSGMVAFLVVLDIIPRLVQVTQSLRYIHWYEGSVIVGSLVLSVIDFCDGHAQLAPVWGGLFGLFAGCFVGMLAAALTEVVNVLPILAKRLGMNEYMKWLLLAMVLGKIIGSLFDWLVFYS